MIIAHQIKTRLNLTQLQTDCIVGTDLLANLHKIPAVIQKNFSAFLVLTDETVFNLYGKSVSDSLTKLSKKVIFSVVKTGEKQKDMAGVPAMVKPFFDQGFDKSACLVALGGGVVTDIGGLLASILLRGIELINIPTSLIGQVDAAIGGKNGVNLLFQGNMLKNMLGTFRQPSLIISDVNTLYSLPKKEIINGLGEIVKYWIGWRKPTVKELTNFSKAIKTPRRCPEDSSEVEELVKTIILCQKIKLDIVRCDPFETKGIREKLNLGHTIGHAIEAVTDGRVTHGEAVSLGLVAAAKISLKMNILPPDRNQIIIDTITKLGLPSSIKNLEIINVLSAIKFDKKGGNFILIKDIGNLISNVEVNEKIITQVLSEIII